MATRDVTFENVTTGKGSPVLILYASANPDERYWKAADTFDITRQERRRPHGLRARVHACLGMGLARLEANALLTALPSRAEVLEVGEPTWRLNNTIRGLESLPVTERSL